MSQAESIPRGLHGRVVHELGQQIASGEIETGQQLLPDELGTRFGVSRTVVREALRVLESKGMIEARPRIGTIVTSSTEWNLLDQDVVAWRVQSPYRKAQLHELLDLRGAVEPIAARRCAETADERHASRLLRHCDEMEQAIAGGDLSTFTEIDIAFHTALLTGSGNKTFQQISGAIEAALRARETLHLLPTHVEQRAVNRHRNLALSIRDADADSAEHISRSLINIARKEITDSFGQPHHRDCPEFS